MYSCTLAIVSGVRDAGKVALMCVMSSFTGCSAATGRALVVMSCYYY
jgi:hypothetical protein